MAEDSPAPECTTLALRRDGCRLHVTLDRPRARNAMSTEMVSELTAVFDHVERSPEIRCVVLRGAGGSFSAGGDIRDLQAAGRSPAGDNDPLAAANRVFGTLLSRIDRAPQAVVCAVEGAAMGGGLGLVCVCDVALALDSSRFGMPEARLGLFPAQIAPFVRRRIGLTRSRRLVVTGATVDGRAAREIGLIHESYSDVEDLDAALAKVLRQIERCGPEAVAASKWALHAAGELEQEELLDRAAGEFARVARGEEAREGLAAFIAKRPPKWAGS